MVTGGSPGLQQPPRVVCFVSQIAQNANASVVFQDCQGPQRISFFAVDFRHARQPLDPARSGLLQSLLRKASGNLVFPTPVFQVSRNAHQQHVAQMLDDLRDIVCLLQSTPPSTVLHETYTQLPGESDEDPGFTMLWDEEEQDIRRNELGSRWDRRHRAVRQQRDWKRIWQSWDTITRNLHRAPQPHV